MRLAIFKDLPQALSPRFQEHLPGALAPNPRQEAYQKLVAGESAVEHVVQGEGVGELAGAVELPAVGEQEQADLRAGDGVVTVGDGVDDGFVDDVETVGDGIATVRPFGPLSDGACMKRATKAMPVSIWSGTGSARRSAWMRSSEDSRVPR